MIKRWLAITLAAVGVFALHAQPAGAVPPPGCGRVAAADRALCKTVQAQHAYGWTDPAGNPQTWVPKGRTLVREITDQGLTQVEMRDYLRAEARNYRHYVTDVSFNVDKIVKQCGHTDGYGAVQLIDEDGKPGGRKYTWRYIMCD